MVTAHTITATPTYSPSNDTSQGVPRTVVKPVQELVVAMVGHVMGGSVVEPEKQGIDHSEHYNVSLNRRTK